MPSLEPLRASAARHARHGRRRLADHQHTAVAAAATRLLATLGVGAFGVAALTATSAAGPVVAAPLAMTVTTPAGSLPRFVVPAVPAAAPARRVASTTHKASVRPAAPSTHHAPPAAKPAPAHKPAQASPAQPAATVKWTPTGTGMWIYQWSETDSGNAGGIVHRAKSVGLSTLYLRTGSSADGITNVGPLRNLLRAAKGTGIHVVAWDFPTLRHPTRDAKRLAAAARIATGGGLRVSAVAPDIETPNEGTYNAASRVRTYLSALHRNLPPNIAVLTAVPWPSSYRIADYPYGTVARGSDVLIPMAYWYDNPPHLVTSRSMDYLHQFGRPVEPVGQGYDGSVDVRGIHNNLAKQVPDFLETAHRHGARGVSLWSWQAAPASAWHALAHARHLFGAGGAANAHH